MNEEIHKTISIILIHNTYTHALTTLATVEICLLSDNIMDYHIVSQGKTTIPSVDDAEEMNVTQVRIVVHPAYPNFNLNIKASIVPLFMC